MPRIFGEDHRGLFGGIEFLFARAHSTNDFAVLEGVTSATRYDLDERDWGFDYQPAGRAWIGYHFDAVDLRMTGWRFRNDVTQAGMTDAPGGIVVDAWGNTVGQALYPIKEFSRGDRLVTTKSFTFRAGDLEIIGDLSGREADKRIRWSAGVRVAEIDRVYRAFVTDRFGLVSVGYESIITQAAGPIIGIEEEYRFPNHPEFSVRSRAAAAILFGRDQFDFVKFNDRWNAWAATLAETRRSLATVDLELGGRWAPREYVSVSAGWLFQFWTGLHGRMDNFAGLVPDRGRDTMWFDAFFLRCEFGY